MRKPLLRFFIVFSLVLLVLTACDHNVYMEEPEKVDGLWKVNGIYFDSLQEAMDYIYGTTKGLGNSKAIEDVPITRIAVLQRNVYNGERGGGLIVPADFEGQLVIDFNGFTYEFDNSLDHFFDIRGGDEVYIINGTTVIYNEADHKPFALAVNTDTVTIDDHLIDDRRWDQTNNKSDAKLFNVGTKGSLVVRDIPSSGTGATLTGVIAIATDGIENGGKIQITNSTLVISNIFTTYQDSEGNIKDKIPSDVDIPEEAKSRIDILSGNVEIQDINQGADYYDGSTLFLKAILNIIKADPDNPERDTIVLNPHSIDTIIEAVVESVTDPEKKAEKIIIHDLHDDWSTDAPGYPATCTTDGREVRWCHYAGCDIGGGEKYHEERAIPALGHDITTEWSLDEANHWHYCTRCLLHFDEEPHDLTDWEYDPETGLSHRYCTVCPYVETETHIHEPVYHARVPHTQTTPGNVEYWQCTICARKFKEEACINEIFDTTDPHVTEHHDAKPHTCTEDGYIEHWECTICHLYFADEAATIPIADIVDPAAHSLVYHAKEEPTCTEAGNVAYYECTACHKNFTDSSATEEIDDVVIPAKGHSPGAWIITESEHYRICSVCDAELDRAGHSHSSEEWEKNETHHYHECDVCSYHMDEDEHSFGEWVIDGPVKKRTCSVCSYVDVEPVGHVHTLEEHAAKDATCTEDGNIHYWYCTGCEKYFSDSEAQTQISQSDIVIPKLNHPGIVYQEAVAATCTETGLLKHWHCPVCDKYYTKQEGGTYSGEKQYSELVTPALGHDMGAWTTVTYPSCTTEGLERRDCSRCDYYETQSIPALGHDLGEWYTTLNPTCTEAGEKRRDCSRCDYYETQAIDPLGHVWSEAWTYDDNIDKDHHWHVCTRCGAINEDSKEEHEFEIVFDADISARKLTIESYCIHCGKRYLNVIPSATGAFDISMSIGIDVVRTAPGVNEWTISIKDSVKEANKNNTCTWYAQSGVELSGLYGTDPITVSIGDEVEQGNYQIRCEFTDNKGNLVDGCILQISK